MESNNCKGCNKWNNGTMKLIEIFKQGDDAIFFCLRKQEYILARCCTFQGDDVSWRNGIYSNNTKESLIRLLQEI